ncbi:MAG: thiamine biosynthesis protein [Deltaproteobacteria bacterium]|nr:thiamine biosynthesis protein [Deltaproteobacteria bacterium]
MSDPSDRGKPKLPPAHPLPEAPEPEAGAPPRRKAIAMISGGLDSSIALQHVKRMGYEVKALNFYTGFCITETHRRMGGRPKDGVYPRNEPLRAAAESETEVEFIDISEEYVDVVTNPRFGYGKNLNPCIDCRIFMLSKAREIMEAEGADFVFTGEVVGQRPKSQRKEALALVEKHSGLKGRLLRPLSGRHLPPVIAEEEGHIRREDLAEMRGRGRKRQIEYAAAYGIDDYPQPAGGCCFLTDETYAQRFADLLEHRPERTYTTEDIVLLSAGRYFRLPDGGRLIVARNDPENKVLELHGKSQWFGDAAEIPGAAGVYEHPEGKPPGEEASRIIAHYGKGRELPEVIVRWRPPGSRVGDEDFRHTVAPMSRAEMDPYLI